MKLEFIKIKKGMTKDEVNELTEKYILLEDYVYLGNNYKHNWKCKCGNLIEGRMWNKIKSRNSTKCNLCAGYIRSGKDLLYENSFAYHIEQELGESLEKYWDFEKNMVNPYHISKGSNSFKVWIKCDNEEINESNGLRKKDYHGSYKITCNNFIKGSRCSYCGNRKVHKYDSFAVKYPDKAKYWHENNDKSPYEVAPGSNKKYKFKCDKCGHIWSAGLNHISRGNWCPKCAGSKGEKRISEWLVKNGIKYEIEKTFDNLISDLGNPLRYDFYLPDYNLLIEYDGIQHDKWIKGLMTKEGFKKLQYHDRLKNEYAKNNNIKLIRIKEKDFDNIEEILRVVF